MSVKILFPPFAEHLTNGPFLAPHLLSTILNDAGVSSAVFDLNIRFIRKITSDQVIKNIVSENNMSLHEEKALMHFLSLPLIEYTKYSGEGFVHVLQILRKYLYTVNTGFYSSINPKNDCNPLVMEVYSELISDLGINELDVIGFSVPFAEQFSESIRLALLLKKQFPHIKLIIGGSQINLLNEIQLKELQNRNIFSVIAIGNGETGIVKLIQEVHQLTDNTLYRFNQSVKPFFESLPFTRFQNLDLYVEKLIVPVLVSRGCYWGKCSFCDYIKLSDINDNLYLIRKPEKVLEEIELLQNFNKDAGFFLVSDAIPPEWYKKLCKLAVDRNVKLRTWSYMLHSTVYDHSFFELLSNAGVKAITFGTESLNNRLLSALNKNFTKETILKNLQDAFGKNLNITVNIIPDIPSTSQHEALTMLSELKILTDYFQVLNIQHFELTAETEMSRQGEKYGIEIIGYNDEKSNHGFHTLRYLEVQGMSEDQKKEVLKEYYEFALKLKIQKRANSILNKEILDSSILFFDPTLFIIEGESSGMQIMNYNLFYKIEEWEVPLFKRIDNRYNHIIKYDEIKNLFYELCKDEKNAFLRYFLMMVKKGMIVKVI